MMDNQTFNVPTDVTGRNSVASDGIGPHTMMNSFVQSYSLDHNHQNHFMAVLPMLPTFDGESVIDCQSDHLHDTNSAGVAESYAFVTSQRRNNLREPPFGSSSFSDHSMFQGIPNSAASFSTPFAASGNLQEDLNNLAISETPIQSSEIYVSNACANISNALIATPENYVYDEILGSINSQQWEINKHAAAPSEPEPGERTSVRTMGLQPYSSSIGNLDPNGWSSSNGESYDMTYHSYNSSKSSNELALTLATSTPSNVDGMNIRDERSDINCSGVVQSCLNQTRFGSGQQASCSSEEPSPSFGSCKPPQLSQVICGSRYFDVIQDILAQIASYSLESLDQSIYSSAGPIATMDTALYREVQNEPISGLLFVQGLVLEKIRASVSADGKKQLVYVGDGAPDFCAGLKLEEGDVLMPRKDFPICDLISANPLLTKARIHEWSDWEELGANLLGTVNSSFIQDESSNLKTDQLVPVDCKYQNGSISATAREALQKILPVSPPH